MGSHDASRGAPPSAGALSGTGPILNAKRFIAPLLAAALATAASSARCASTDASTSTSAAAADAAASDARESRIESTNASTSRAARSGMAPYSTNEIFLPNIYSMKRKVQWDGGRDHEIIRTEHFEIVVAEGEEELGLRIAGIAEPFFERLERRLGVDFNAPITPERERGPGRIPLIAYTSLPRFQETNTTPGFLPEGVRGFFEFAKGRIVFPHTGSNSLLEHVAQHEITHAFALNLSERTYEEHRARRKLVRSRRGDWKDLASEARRLAKGTPKNTFGKVSRDTVHPKGIAVGLPNREAESAAREGRALLAPRVYVGYPENADGSPDDKTFLLSLEVVGTERMKALEDAATLDSLVSALRLLPDSARVVVRRLTWDYIWEILPTTQVVFDATSHDAANDPAALARALREAAAPLQSQWARMQPELVLGETAAPRSHRLSERLAPLLPAYHALSEIPIVIETGGDGDDDASVAVDVAAGAWPPPSETWNAAEDSLFRWNGSSVKPRILPLALNEGAAEYFGSDWDALEEMVLRDALLTNYLPSIRNLGPGYGYLVYVGGESFLRYLGRTYGDESVALLLQSLYLGQRLSEGAVAIFGKDLDDLSDEWHEDLRRAVFPEYDETEGTEDWADEISDGPYDTFPRVHGDRMVYKRARRGRTELVLRDARNEHVIVSDRRPGAESLHLLEGAQDVRDSILAFAVQKKGRDVLRVASASGSNIGATIAEHGWDGILSITGLSIAPDCRRVALTAMNSRGHADLYVASLDGGALSQITDDIYEEASPCWGARGIVFSSDRASKDSHDLFLHEPDVAPRDPEESAPQGDGGIVQLTDTPWNETEPSWLEESGRLLVLDDREGRRNIYFVDPVTGASGAITRDRVGIVHADTDGEHVVASVLSGLQMTTWEAPLDRLLEAASVPLVAQASGDTTATSAPSIANELPHASDDAAPVTSELPPPQPLVGLAIRPGLSHSEWQPAPPPEHAQVPYRPRYGADVLLVNATSVASGAYLGISDLLGNRQLAFILGSSGGGADNFFRFLNVGAIYSNLEGRYDWRVGLVRSANDVLTEEQGFFFERNTGALFGMTYPIDRFRSVSWTLAGSIVEHEPIGEPKDTFGEVSAQTVLGHDTTVSDEYGYGYGNGLLTSLLLTVDYRVTKPAGWGSFTGLYDLRYYFPLVGRVFVATRASYGLSTGQVPQRIRLGGSWTLRGFGFNDLQGDRFALGNAELRFPLPVLAQVGPFPLIRAVQGALFADVGDAWFEGHHAHPNAALGFGFRTGFAGTVIRYDVSWLYSEQRGGWRDGVNGDLFLGYNF